MTSDLRPAAFYGRVSDNSDESIDGQLMFCREVAAREGYYIPETAGFQFADVHVRGMTRSRPGFDALQRVVSSSSSVPFDRVYIREQKRFGRWKDPRLHDYYAVLFETHGVTLRFCNKARQIEFSEGMHDADVGTYLSEKIDHIHTSRERTEIDARMRRGRRLRMLGGYLPAGRAPYGLVRVLVSKVNGEVARVLEPGESTMMPSHHVSLRCGDAAEIRVVRFIFDAIESGQALLAIARDLNDRKIPPPGAAWWRTSQPSRGHELFWYSATVRAIARNAIYMGVHVWGNRRLGPALPADQSLLDSDQPIRIEEFLPDPPISREQFDRVQQLLSGNSTLWTKRRAARPKYLLAGKVRCAHCKRLLHGKKANRGCLHHTYCHSITALARVHERCPHLYFTVPHSALETPVLDQLRVVLSDPDLAERVREHLRALLTDESRQEDMRVVAQLERRLRAAQQSLSRATEALVNARSGSAREMLQRSQESAGQNVDQLQEELRQIRTRDLEVRKVMEREIWLVTASSELLALLDKNDFDAQRLVIERAIEYVEFNYELRQVEIAMRLA